MESFYIIVAVLGMVVAISGTIYIHYDFKQNADRHLNKKNNKKVSNN